MTIIQNQVAIDKPVATVYAFLADCNNHEQLMPEMVYNWSSTRDEAQFTIQNMAKLSIRVDSRKEDNEVVFVPAAKAPFAVTLRWLVTPQAANHTLAKLVIEADLNMMMKMVATKPLQKLVDEQVNNLRKVLSE